MNNILSRKIEQLADHGSDVSMRELLTKIYVRPKVFWSCLIIPVVLALAFTALVPTTWSASVKIMLRYSSSESAFLRDLIPENRALLSGASSAEILKGIPTLVNTIREQKIKDEDIYKKPHEVLGGYLSGFLEDYFPSSLPPGLPGIDPKTLLLAKAFKDSLEESSSLSGSSSKKKPVEILDKSSQMPASQKGDELITVEVRSFNREKVASMANGLASAFIDEYYRVSTEEARHSYEFLTDLAEKAEKDVRTAQNVSEDAAQIPSLIGSGHADIARNSPLLEGMSKELVNLRNALTRAEGIYADSSEPVLLLRHQVEQATADMAQQERIEGAKQVLEQLKLRRFQALNTEHLYKNRLIPISVVEPAFTPKKSFSKVAVRYLIAGVVGLVLGLMLAIGLVVVLDVIDPYLRTSWQTGRTLKLPVMAALPDLGNTGKSTPELVQHFELFGVNGMLQLLGKMVHARKKISRGRVIVVSSAQRGEGRTFFSLALAETLAGGKHHKVLLVDAELGKAGLSELLHLAGTPGYIEAMINHDGVEGRIVENAYHDCDLLPAGNIAASTKLGFYSEELGRNIERLRELYDFVIIDTAAVLSSNEALICGMMADSVLLVVSMGQSRKVLVQSAVQRLRDVGVQPEGIIINRQREVLPAFIYRNV